MAVSPDSIANSFERIGLELGLGKEAAEKSGEHIAASTLRKIRIAAGIHEDLAAVAADESVVTFENDPAIAVFCRNGAEGRETILLHSGGLDAEQACGFSRVWSENATGVQRGGTWLDPIESGGIHDHRDR